MSKAKTRTKAKTTPKAIKVPLFGALEEMGIPTSDVQGQLNKLRADYPAGEVPVVKVHAILAQFFDAVVMNQIVLAVREGK